MKRFISFCMAVLMLVGITGCSAAPKTEKFQYQFFDTFDTLIQIVGYADSQEEFDVWARQAHERFRQLNDLFDRFDDHGREDGIAAVNAQAGIAPVAVDPVVMELVEFSLQWQEETDSAVDITMGPVISLWQSYISRYSGGAEGAKLPAPQELETARALCGRQFLEVDREAGTLYLTQKGAMLDLGAVAKGYATELVAQELQQAGWESFSISSGGNVRTAGAPQNGRESWSVGIQNPESGAVLGSSSELLDVVYANDLSVVTSGDYQRFYMVGEKRLHHIIDPATAMPAEGYRAVTVVTPHSGTADLLSTALFIMDKAEGEILAQKLGAGVLWVMPDGSVACNEIILPMLRSHSSSR